MSDRKVMRRALVSVYDKTRLLEIGTVLSDAGIEILSTGSTPSHWMTTKQKFPFQMQANTT